MKRPAECDFVEISHDICWKKISAV